MTSLANVRIHHASAILFECVAGSRAYGTGLRTSDEDIRGIFAVPAAEYLDLTRPPDLLSDERGDIVYYSLRRAIELLSEANPNILELLFMPEDCIRKTSPEMHLLIANRHLFISKHCADTHAGYAIAQIRKAKGQNNMSRKSSSKPREEMRPEYDFSGGVRGRFCKKYMKGTNVVVLDPDVAEIFPNSAAVNQALRLLAEVASKQAKGKPKRAKTT